MSSACDHSYLDLEIVNNDRLGSQLQTNLQFSENRSNPILDNPSNYEMSVVRFEVDTPAVTLPVFIPLLNVDGVNNNLNKTDYTVTMAQINSAGTALTNLQTANVMWSPEDKTATLPKNGTVDNTYFSSQDITTGYYNCYNVKWWLSCVNATLDSVWKQVSGLSTSEYSPSLVVDDGTNLITLLTPIQQTKRSSYVFNFAVSDNKATGSGLPIYLSTGSFPIVQYVLFFNEPLFNLFSGFPSVYYGDTLASKSIFDNPADNATVLARPYLLDYFIQPINYGNYNIIKIQPPLIANSYNWVTTSSEYSPIPMWSPIMSLQITSTLLPNLISYTTADIPYNSLTANGFQSTGNNSQISDMITDIEVGLTTGSEYKPSVLYIPKGQYRLIDLHGSEPINNVDFKISWKTKYGQVIAFKLGAQCGANLKILFRRKRFDSLNLPPYNTN